jgi:hypothetical protein
VTAIGHCLRPQRDLFLITSILLKKGFGFSNFIMLIHNEVAVYILQIILFAENINNECYATLSVFTFLFPD